ncbi:S1/P1 Nuclease [Altererythrobacter aurantiacus]|uniref:S1/P1 Nuclease n=1 Tax=Parapontixanthobacter aurantiacus TaxID=1463599 RepID=A0A844ZFG0_9SPHN|nr:S1/P1 nuclease [Parapontixanthobacter aurantiacus]MXO86508.1 S1/P1 Nuclease [Parapontixanthobacter aurantiacus]
MRRHFAILATIVVLGTPSVAHAWGQTGHRVIGEIAQQNVSGKTRAEIELILGNEDLAEASTWADEERSNPDVFWQREAGPYHYVTVPTGKAYTDVETPDEGDALSALERFTQVLRDPAATREDKALALRFVVHIVGDVHQPLHAGNGDDRGGNDVTVSWFGEETNLHSVWDSKLIDSRNLSYTEYANWLMRSIEPAQTITWWTADPLVWIAESTRIRDDIYPSEEAVNLGYAYQYEHLNTAEARLQQGGIRLAAYLDYVFANDAL